MRHAVLITTLLVFGSSARAQPAQPWLVVPIVEGGEQAWMQRNAEQVRADLVEKGVDVWSLSGAAHRFEEKASAPAAEVSQGDIQEWVDRSTNAIRKLAEGDYVTALEELNKAQALSIRAAEELNRERQRAQRVLDTCLYMVRVLLETGSESRARTLTQECRKLVPRVVPTRQMHPPVVLQMLGKVDELRAHQKRALRVESHPSQCPVRVNGVMLGETPFEMGNLLAGEYRVQVECDPGQRGRVHIADLSEGSADLYVDLRFDRAIETRPLLHLGYSDDASRERYRDADLERVSEVLPTGAFVLLSMPEDEVMQLELVRATPVQPRAVARIHAGPRGPNREDLDLASRTLIDGKCVDFATPEPIALPCREDATDQAAGPDGWPARRMLRRQFVAGVTLASFGAAALATSYVLPFPRESVADDWLNEIEAGATTDQTKTKWLNLGKSILATSVTGAAALVAAMPLALPKRDKTPWPAWLAGGLGVGLAATSVALGVTAEAEPSGSCSQSTLDLSDATNCIRRSRKITGAILAGVTAAPLLTIPLVYWFRPKGQSLEPVVNVSRSGAYFGLRGAL